MLENNLKCKIELIRRGKLGKIDVSKTLVLRTTVCVRAATEQPQTKQTTNTCEHKLCCLAQFVHTRNTTLALWNTREKGMEEHKNF